MWSVGVIVGVGLLVHYSVYGYRVQQSTAYIIILPWDCSSHIIRDGWIVLSDYILLTVELIIIVNVGCM